MSFVFDVRVLPNRATGTDDVCVFKDSIPVAVFPALVSSSEELMTRLAGLVSLLNAQEKIIGQQKARIVQLEAADTRPLIPRIGEPPPPSPGEIRPEPGAPPDLGRVLEGTASALRASAEALGFLSDRLKSRAAEMQPPAPQG